jgi:putative acetyltransferase
MSDVSPRIADMTLDNWRAVIDLWVQAWSQTMPDIDFEARRDWLIGQRAIYARDGTRVRVALDRLADTVLGVITLRPRDGYIDQLAVAHERWGGGVAMALIADAQRLSPRQLFLFVNQANGRAIAFYEKAGFRRTAAEVNAQSGLPTWRYEWAPA